jgi:heme-degrading monooxygenase HmoA
MRKSLIGCGLALLLAALPAKAQESPVYQLRVYGLNEASKPVFHARFRDHAMRIMRRHGFDIVAIWEAVREGRPEFVYLLRWPDEAALKKSWEAFRADPEWAAIKQATVSPDAPIMGGIQDRTMRLTDYSPAFR